MNIGGFLKNSFVDYPKKVASVIFASGCNFDCWYCHNRRLIKGEEKEIDFAEILSFLKTRQGLIDGVVFSGGEPTLYPDLKEKIQIVRDMGFSIKLDTNGSNPKILEDLLKYKLLDYVAMDIKTSLSHYESISACDRTEEVKESIRILMNSEVDYEFRTTFAPDVSLEDIEDIAKSIKGANAYYIQKYIPYPEHKMLIPHHQSDFEKALQIASRYVENTRIRN